MAKKPAIVKETVAAAAPKTARAAKPKTPRVTAAKHSKTASAEMSQAPEKVESSAVQTVGGNPSEVIAKIAYGYWEARGRQGGSPIEDWVRAERECTNQASA